VLHVTCMNTHCVMRYTFPFLRGLACKTGAEMSRVQPICTSITQNWECRMMAFIIIRSSDRLHIFLVAWVRFSFFRRGIYAKTSHKPGIEMPYRVHDAQLRIRREGQAKQGCGQRLSEHGAFSARYPISAVQLPRGSSSAKQDPPMTTAGSACIAFEIVSWIFHQSGSGSAFL
jgi:hypothetical protein